jgi:hypothetical protein
VSDSSSAAEKLGYLPIVLSSVLDGDARKVGAMFGMLARYAALSFGFKSSNPRNTDYVQLELDLVAGGVAKQIHCLSNSNPHATTISMFLPPFPVPFT